MMDLSRRNLIGSGGALLIALAVGEAATAAGPACPSVNSLPFSQRNQRRSLGYLDSSPDAKKRCGGCAFFTGTQVGCGKCQMLGGGMVSADATCNSFAPKP
jgi:High potential iron-sulfur protein